MADLLDELAAAPHDRDDGLRAYADQLILAGEPFGELIVVALERVARSTPELARREATLIQLIEAQLHGRLARFHPAYRWRIGFLDAIRFEVSGGRAHELVETLAHEPCCRMLRRIELVATPDVGVALLLGDLVHNAQRFPRLVELVLRFRPLEREHARVPVRLREAFPRLEVLELDVTHLAPDSLELPALRVLSLDGVGPSQLRTIVAPELANLEHLALRFEPVRIANVDATFGPLLHRDFPRLRTLSLDVPLEMQTWLAHELPRSPLVRELDRLGLRLADEAALATLLDSAHLLRHLTLALDHASLTAAMRRRFAKAFAPRIEFR